MKARTIACTIFVAALAMLLAACSPGPNAIGKAMKSSEGPSSSSVADPLDGVKLVQMTEFLEYSQKDVDPLTLVDCEEPGVEIATKDKIDLSKVGVQNVQYTLSKDGASEEKAVSFTVRDTHAPEIAFQEEAPAITQGDAYDVLANIASVTDPVDGTLPHVDAEPAALSNASSSSASSSTSSPSSSSTPSSASSASPSSSKNNVGAGLSRIYDSGWYTVSSEVDAATPGSYAVTVTASDIHGNHMTKSFTVTVNAAPVAEAAAAPAPAPEVHQYVLNTNTKKFHTPGCSSVKKMKDKNRQDFEGTRDEVIAMGYDPCGNCHP